VEHHCVEITHPNRLQTDGKRLKQGPAEAPALAPFQQIHGIELTTAPIGGLPRGPAMGETDDLGRLILDHQENTLRRRAR